jgi:colicin import membrane protein
MYEGGNRMPPEEEIEVYNSLQDHLLVKVEEVDAQALFVDGGVDAILAYIQEQIDWKGIQKADLEKESGRKEITSTAYAIARVKNALDSKGTDLADKEREKVKETIDAIQGKRKHSWTFLEDLQAQVKERLTERQARIDAEQAEKLRIAEEKRQAEQEELERLRQEKAERDARDAQRAREEQIRREAEEKAQREQQEALEAEKKKAQDALLTGRLSQLAECAMNPEGKVIPSEGGNPIAYREHLIDWTDEEFEAVRMKREERVAEIKQQHRKKEVEEARQRAEREKQAAIDAERQRVADERAMEEIAKEREEEERLAREQDEVNRRRIRSEAFDSLWHSLELDRTTTVSRRDVDVILDIIDEGLCAHVSINYSD